MRSKWKKKVNRAVSRLNTFLEPRVIRHGWTPQIGGGMGYDTTAPNQTPADGYNALYNKWGIVQQDPLSSTYPTGFFSWMYDVASNTTPDKQALLVPQTRHNPFLYCSFDTLNGFNHWPGQTANPNGFVTGQPRSRQFNGSYPVPLNSPGWVGGAWNGGYDQLFEEYYRPHSMLNACMLLQSASDVVGYKQFPFLPRVEKDYDQLNNLSLNQGGQAGPAITKIYQKLEPWECRDGDRLRVKTNYHSFVIECVPDLDAQIPEDTNPTQMPGLPTSNPWAQAGTGVTGQDVLTIGSGGAIGAGSGIMLGNKGTITDSAVPPSVGPFVMEGSQAFPMYVMKKAKWFCKVRFIVAKRQRVQENTELPGSRALHLFGTRMLSQLERNYLYDLGPHIRKYVNTVNPAIPPVMTRGDYNNSFFYHPFSLSKEIAADIYKLRPVKRNYKSGITTQALPVPPTTPSAMNFTTTNAPDKTLKIIYDKEVTLSGRKTRLVHTMNTLKGKVLNYLRESSKFGATPSLVTGSAAMTLTPTVSNQETHQQPFDTEYRLWTVVHCHNCSMQMRGKHVFKFDA